MDALRVPDLVAASATTTEKGQALVNDHPSNAVAVYGATGHTGRFVIQELSRRGLTAIAIGRSETKLSAADFPAGVRRAVATLEDPASLALAFAGAAEQACTQATFEQYGAAAERAGVVVLPAMAFFGGLSDLLTTAAMNDWTRADEVRIGIALDSWHPTEGTRRTGRRNTAPRVTISRGGVQPLVQPPPNAVWVFPKPFGAQEMVELPFSEVILIERHLQVAELHTYLNTAPLRDLRDTTTPPPVGTDASGRSAQTFRVEVEVHLGRTIRRVSAHGRDIYAVTAPLVVEAVARLLRNPTAQGGVFAPGALFDAEDFLTALAPHILP